MWNAECEMPTDAGRSRFTALGRASIMAVEAAVMSDSVVADSPQR